MVMDINKAVETLQRALDAHAKPQYRNMHRDSSADVRVLVNHDITEWNEALQTLAAAADAPKNEPTKVYLQEAATMQESIQRVTDGRGCSDKDIKRVISLGKHNSLAIGDKTYTVRDIANAIKVAEMFAFHRWGANWVEEVGVV